MVFIYIPTPHQQIHQIHTEQYDRGIPITRYAGSYKARVTNILQVVQTALHHNNITLPRKKRVFSLFPELTSPPTNNISLGLFISLLHQSKLTSPILVIGDLDHHGNILPLELQTSELNFIKSMFPILLGNVTNGEQFRVYLRCSHINQIPELLKSIPTLVDSSEQSFTKETFSLYKTNARLFEILAIASAENLHLLLAGPVGIGKTTAVRVLQELNKPPLPKILTIGPQSFTSHQQKQLHLQHHDPYILEISELPLLSKTKLASIIHDLDHDTKPANLKMCVATMNLCPCGKYNTSACTCTPHLRALYTKRLHGNLLDRFDLQLLFPADPMLIQETELNQDQLDRFDQLLELIRTYPTSQASLAPEEIRNLFFRIQRLNPSTRMIVRAKRVFRAVKWFKRDLSTEEQIKTTLNLLKPVL